MKSQELVDKFTETLSEYGDMFFSTGNADTDADQIKAIIAHQGYWAGGSVRYFFDGEFNLVGLEERRFGA